MERWDAGSIGWVERWGVGWAGKDAGNVGWVERWGARSAAWVERWGAGSI